ncbi:DUF2512 family protein [Priestia megaterium]|nr:DUF2512 family protein [Priestia megaterium]
MKLLTILLIKFVTCLIAFAIGLDLFFEATIVDIVSFSLFVTIVSYMLGDRIILPALGNMAATTFDFVLTYMSVWIFGSILLENYLQIAWGSILSAAIITAVEVLVHRYSLTHFFADRTAANQRPRFNRKLAYGTEFAEEQDIELKDNKNNKETKK